MKLTEHFTLEEFRCRCGCGCEQAWVEECRRTAEILESLRAQINADPELDMYRVGDFSITVECGVRCPKRNVEVGGADHSAHLSTDYQGAADTWVPGLPEAIWARYAFKHFKGCILYTKKHFVHVDRRRNAVYYAIDGRKVDNLEA